MVWQGQCQGQCPVIFDFSHYFFFSEIALASCIHKHHHNTNIMSPSKHNDLQGSANGNNSYDEQDGNRSNSPDLRDIFASILASRPLVPLPQRGNASPPLSQEERNRLTMETLEMAILISNDDFVLPRENSDEDDFSLDDGPPKRRQWAAQNIVGANNN